MIPLLGVVLRWLFFLFVVVVVVVVVRIYSVLSDCV
jgi:hypothetical protein